MLSASAAGGRVTQRHSWHSWLSAYKWHSWHSWHTVCQLVNCVNCANCDPSSKRSPFAVAMKKVSWSGHLGEDLGVVVYFFSHLTVHSLVQYKTHPLHLGNFLEALNSKPDFMPFWRHNCPFSPLNLGEIHPSLWAALVICFQISWASCCHVGLQQGSIYTCHFWGCCFCWTIKW